MQRRVISGIFFVVLVLAACNPNPAAMTVTPLPSQIAATLTPAPTITPTPEPPKNLTICLGQEPRTLYPFGSSSRITWSVLEAVYDGPFDSLAGGTSPVILQKMPSMADGDAVIEGVDVLEGETIVDVDGSLNVLQPGVHVLPAGCSNPECELTWDGSSPIKMDQIRVTFRLLPGLAWSDGMPLTAKDSVYSYNLSADPDTPVTKAALDRTASYTANDDLTVTWTGKPGFIPSRYDTYFWLPLPEHAWGGTSAKDLLNADFSSKLPLGWGPYVIKEWTPNDHIRLGKNQSYFRANEGLPYFDNLVYRFLGEPADNNLAALLVGECDVVDESSLLDEQLEMLLELKDAGKLNLYIVQGPEWEFVTLGIQPATYDDGYRPDMGERPDFFTDLRVRQAFAYCMDRTGIVDEVLFGQSYVPASYIPVANPLAANDLASIPFDVATGTSLLDAAGWKELDGDPETPRTAVGIANIYDGTPLSVTYATTLAPVRVEIANRLAASLKQCGIQVEVQTLEPGQLLGPGPDGPVFGRHFDLAEWGFSPVCSIFTSAQIPNVENAWVGLNVTGYHSDTFDAACKAANMIRPDDPAYVQKIQDAQRMFAQELPAIPLYFRPKMAMSRPDLCGLNMDIYARSALWNLEEIMTGEGCK